MPVERRTWNRVVLACQRCRRKKKRCDGISPTCSACVERGFAVPCVYTKAPERRSPPSIQRDQSSHSSSGSLQSDEMYVEPPESSHDFDETRATINHETEPFPDRSATADGIATVAFLKEGAEYGPTSTAAFLEQIVANKQPVQGLLCFQQPMSNTTTSLIELQRRAQGAVVHPATKRQADGIAEPFWDYVHPIFPFVNRKIFAAHYQVANRISIAPKSKPADADGACQATSFYLILALACRAEDDTARADGYYAICRSIFPQDILDLSSPMALEMLLLTCIFLQLTAHAAKAWNTLGLAVRMAVGLGMHVDAEGSKGSLHDRTSRRMMWHSCVVLDRFSALTFGRPSMTTFAWKVPISDDIESEDHDATAHKQVPAALHCFTASCHLLAFVPEILEIHSDVENVDRAAVEHLCRILDLDQRLTFFHSSLPSSLRDLYLGNSVARFQYGVFQARYLLIRLLLHRPFLTMALERESELFNLQPSDQEQASATSVDRRLIQRSAAHCAATACELARLVYELQNSGCVPWHAVYFSFSALLVIIAFQKTRFDAQGSSGPPLNLELATSHCLTVLEVHQLTSPAASQALKVLSILACKERKAAANVDSLKHMHLHELQLYQENDSIEANTIDVTGVDIDWNMLDAYMQDVHWFPI